MKTLLTFVFTLFLTTLSFAQDCVGYFPQTKGTKFEILSYDKKDKLSGTLKYEVLESTQIPGGISIMLKNEMTDAKGKQVVSMKSTTECINGEYYTDLNSVGSEFMPKSPDVEVTITGDKLVYPNNLKAGQKLKDISTTVKTSMSGMTLMNINISITDREVIGFETIETPAGKFECAKITFTSSFQFMGNRITKTTEYIAKNVGVVKSETYDGAGNKQSSTLMNKFEK